MTPLPTLIVTLGDPSGIGPEILLKSLPQLTHRARIVIIGSRAGIELFQNLNIIIINGYGAMPLSP